MLGRLAKNFLKNFSVPIQRRHFRVTVIGAAGGIGQPLSLLLKLNKYVTELKLFDIVGTMGVAADLSHIDTNVQVRGFVGDKELSEALECAEIVVIAAGLPRKPGMTRDDLFDKNADLIKYCSYQIAENCPKALIAIITNPLNSVVPICAEVLKIKRVYNPKRLFGVSTLDVVRTRTFLGEAMHIDPKIIKVEVIGGHSGVTILPVLSGARPVFKADCPTIKKMTERIQNAGTEVVKAKAGKGSATLSTAYAAHRLVNSMLRAKAGKKNVIEIAYVPSKKTRVPYFATSLELGPKGITDIHEVPVLVESEEKILEKTLEQLKKDIKKGVDYIKKKK